MLCSCRKTGFSWGSGSPEGSCTQGPHLSCALWTLPTGQAVSSYTDCPHESGLVKRQRLRRTTTTRAIKKTSVHYYERRSNKHPRERSCFFFRILHEQCAKIKDEPQWKNDVANVQHTDVIVSFLSFLQPSPTILPPYYYEQEDTSGLAVVLHSIFSNRCDQET